MSCVTSLSPSKHVVDVFIIDLQKGYVNSAFQILSFNLLKDVRDCPWYDAELTPLDNFYRLRVSISGRALVLQLLSLHNLLENISLETFSKDRKGFA